MGEGSLAKPIQINGCHAQKDWAGFTGGEMKSAQRRITLRRSSK